MKIKKSRVLWPGMLAMALAFGFVMGCDSTPSEPAPTTATLSIRDGTPGDAALELVLSAGKWTNPDSRSSYFTYNPEEGRPSQTNWNRVDDSVLRITFSKKDWTGTLQFKEANLTDVVQWTNLETLTLGTNDPVTLVVKQ
ncbi:MAG: hypothetical protein LBS57_03275 [Treponema sp.]|jgi:hypothetical protein|nr:hypothetical protein [Treponema sp.]